MTIEALQPGVSIDQVRENTGFELEVANDVDSVSAPTELELRRLRSLETGEPDGVPAESAERVIGR
jgi:glutaconate CoA-transferase subunit B